jgi:hypothetical protein
MRACCPAGRGCNSHTPGEACALELLREAALPSAEATLALERWAALQKLQKCSPRARAGERRFRQRSYERARDRALIGLALSSAA